MSAQKLVRSPFAWIPAALILLWPVTLRPTFVVMPPRGGFSDLLITHWPNSVFLRRAILESGQIPLWNPSILAGQPFAADPLAGLWYPPNWLTLAAPLPLAFNLLFGLHLAWAGWGMFRFLRLEGLADGPAILGGIAFAGTPKWIAHLGAGHVTFVFALAWTPWLLIAFRRAIDGGWRHAAAAGAAFAVLTLADVRWAAYAGALALADWLYRFIAHTPAREHSAALRAQLRTAAGRLMVIAAFAGMLSAILLIPFGEFLARTPRAALTPAEAAILSLPPRYLLGVLIPDLAGFHEWMTYLGFLPLALAATAAACPSHSHRRAVRFWALVLLGGIAFSLGTATPLFGLLLRLTPGLGLLRVPSRAWFLVAFAAAALAACGAEGLGGQTSAPFDELRTLRARRAFSLAAFGGAAFAVLMALAVWLRLARPEWSFVMFGLAACGGLALMTARVRGRISRRAFLVLAVGLTLADLAAVGGTLIAMRDPASQFEPFRPLAEFLQRNGRGGRTYSPSYSLPQHVGAQFGLEQADGVHPLQLAETASFMRQAAGAPVSGYSVMLPPFDGDPAIAADAVPDAQMLALLSVRYVLAEFPLRAEGLVERARFGQTYVYENALARPRAWLEPEAAASPEAPLPASSFEFTPNRITVTFTADRPSVLVLSEVYYPGWSVRLDDRPAGIVAVHGLLRGVEVAPGAHRAVFEFRPASVFLGAGLTMIGIIGLAALWAPVVVRCRSREPGA